MSKKNIKLPLVVRQAADVLICPIWESFLIEKVKCVFLGSSQKMRKSQFQISNLLPFIFFLLIFFVFHRLLITPLRYTLMIEFGTVLLSVVLHFCVFLVTKYVLGRTLLKNVFKGLTPLEQNRWCERTASFVHSVVATQGSLRTLYILLPKPITVRSFSAPICATSDGVSEGYLLAEFYMSFTLGYFFYDMLLFLTFSPGHEAMDFVHHIISSAQYAVNLVSGWGYFVPVVLLTNEISSPFLHVSWFLGKCSDLGMKGCQKWFIPCQVVFALLFVLFRIVFATFIYILTIWSKLFDKLCLESPAYLTYTSILGFTLFLVVQFFWFKAIFWKFYYVVTGAPEKSWKKKHN